MTQGVDLLSSIIQNQTVSSFKNIRAEWMIGDEAGLYQFINTYLSNYRTLPTYDVLAQNGYELNRNNIVEPVQYYIDTVCTRNLMNKARDADRLLADSYRRYDVEGIQAAYRILSSAMVSSTSQVKLTSLHEESLKVMNQARDRLTGEGRGYTTGYEVFDRATGGHRNGNLDVWVGRLGTGKTYCMADSARKNWIGGAKVLFVSLEMSNDQMTERILGIHSGINPKAFKTGELCMWSVQAANEAISEMLSMQPFHFLVADIKTTTMEIESAINLVDPDIIYIDAGYLLSTGSKYRQNRGDTVAEVVNELKGTTTRSNKPTVMSVQFNRAAESFKVKSNKAGDVKISNSLSTEHIAESDMIGKTASNILGIHPPAKDRAAQRYRIVECLKARDGEQHMKIKINYLFEPPNFDYISMVENESEDGPELLSPEAILDSAWSSY